MSNPAQRAIQHVTLATDLSTRSDRAFDRALDLARRWKSQLLIVHAVEDRGPESLVPSWRQGSDPIETARRRLLTEYPGLEDVQSAIEVSVGIPRDVVLAAAARENTDLIIAGVGRESVYGRRGPREAEDKLAK